MVQLEFTVSSPTFVRQRQRFTFSTMRSTLCATFSLMFILKHLSAEIWEQDLSKEFEIGASTEGYDRVGLRCGVERLMVDIQMSQDFSGVIYTQGSFYSKPDSCFLDPVRGKNFTINIPFDECKTEKNGDTYRNIVVIQHDDELITPGDAAFIMECDFSKPIDLDSKTSDINETKEWEVKSRISLVDADPGRDKNKRVAFVESKTERVVFAPKTIIRANDEF